MERVRFGDTRQRVRSSPDHTHRLHPGERTVNPTQESLQVIFQKFLKLSSAVKLFFACFLSPEPGRKTDGTCRDLVLFTISVGFRSWNYSEVFIENRLLREKGGGGFSRNRVNLTSNG